MSKIFFIKAEVVYFYDSFPGLKDARKVSDHNPTWFQFSIVKVNQTGEWRDKEKYKFKEWLKCHYADLHFEVLKGQADTVLLNYMLKRQNLFLVMGAYGRNAVSRFFNRTRADILVKAITQPIFIAHL